MCDKEDIKKSLTSLMRLKSHDITPQNIGSTIDYFFSILGDMPPEVLEAATLHYLSTATWFPTPGNIRESAIALQMLALNVPEPAEAWAEVISPTMTSFPSTLCEEGAGLKDACEGKQNGDYGKAIREYGDHKDDCKLCKGGGFKKVYSHPAIEMTVERLGGRSTLLTTIKMEGADRARFMDSYKAIIATEKTLAGMPSAVRGFVETRKQELIESRTSGAIGLLADRLGT